MPKGTIGTTNRTLRWTMGAVEPPETRRCDNGAQRGALPETGMGVTATRPSRRRHGDILWKFLDSEAADHSARMTD